MLVGNRIIVGHLTVISVYHNGFDSFELHSLEDKKIAVSADCNFACFSIPRLSPKQKLKCITTSAYNTVLFKLHEVKRVNLDQKTSSINLQ